LEPADYEAITKKLEIFDSFTQDFSCDMGKMVSKSERNTKNLTSSSLTYGEIDFASIAEVFRFINIEYGLFQNKGGVFYDLGSGTGKGVLTACLLHEFDKCVGIELLEGLYETSLHLKEIYDNEFSNVMNDNHQLFPFTRKPEIILKSGDILEIDWSDGDLVLANSTCFSQKLMEDIAVRSKYLKVGSILITLTKSLPDTINWTLMKSIRKLMSWGPATVHIHRKLK